MINEFVRGGENMDAQIKELDVRPLLNADIEPFKEIMGAVKQLEPGDQKVSVRLAGNRDVRHI